jgi:pimeloyl-ACP methyl ester carboxylesterase
MVKKIITNEYITIEYILLNYKSNSIPLVIIPGAIAGADDIVRHIKNLSIFSIIVSLRGRGHSSSPLIGYSKDDQISDIENVLKAENINKLHILGHSFGASLASYYTVRNPNKVMDLILVDYPPGYPEFSVDWGVNIKRDFPEVNRNLINGLINESTKENYINELNKTGVKILIIKASDNSMISNKAITKISETLLNCKIKIIDNSSHEVFIDKPEEVINIIEKFINN